jgi:parvulin-like peptidyl-prolyl isomerase
MRLVFCLLGWLALGGIGAGHAQPRIGDGIAAIVNDAVITFHEVRNYTQPVLEVLGRTYFSQPEAFEQKQMEALTKGLEDLVEKQLILDDFRSQGGALPDNIIDDEINARIRQRFGDRARLTKTLQAQGLTYETYRQRTRDEIIVGFMRQKNIAAAIVISPAKIERYYATNLNQFKVGEQVKLRMIVLNAPSGLAEEKRKLAEEILAKINEGASFTEMASIYSEGSQRQAQGDWGWVERSVLQKGLSDAAFDLSPGKHSDVIGLANESSEVYWICRYDKTGRMISARKYSSRDTSVEGKTIDEAGLAAQNLPPPQLFYLMLVEDKRVARVRALQEVRDEIEKELIAQERARLQRKWIDRLKKRSFVLYF